MIAIVYTVCLAWLVFGFLPAQIAIPFTLICAIAVGIAQLYTAEVKHDQTR